MCYTVGDPQEFSALRRNLYSATNIWSMKGSWILQCSKFYVTDDDYDGD